MSEQHSLADIALAVAALEAGISLRFDSVWRLDDRTGTWQQGDVLLAAGLYEKAWGNPIAALAATAKALDLPPHPAIQGLVDALRAAAKLTTNVEQSMCGAADLLAQTPMYTRAAQQLRELADDAGRQRDAMRELLGEEADPHA